MSDIEKLIKEVLESDSRLAEVAGEEFVIAVTVAYIAGKEAGKLAAQQAG